MAHLRFRGGSKIFFGKTEPAKEVSMKSMNSNFFLTDPVQTSEDMVRNRKWKGLGPFGLD